MLEGFKRLFSGGTAAAARGWEGIAPWAESKQYSFRGVQAEGFVIDGRLGTTAWRLEWGPSQRPYIQGQELRLRSELGLANDLQVVVMNRVLQEQMERDVFDQYVEGVQTRIDNQTPPEMRWLVMYTKLVGSELGRLRERYAAVGSVKGWLQQWLGGPLNDALAATLDVANGHDPMVMTIQRGRLTLRTPMAKADTAAMVMWLSVFEHALREARRLNGEWQASADVGNSTQPAAWPKSMLPGDDGA